MVLEADVDLEAVEPFLREGMVAEVLDLIKSGKEANAYLCRGGRDAGRDLAVLKIYHNRERRNFSRSSVYTQGRLVLNGQVRRAINARSEFGKAFVKAVRADGESIQNYLEAVGFTFHGVAMWYEQEDGYDEWGDGQDDLDDESDDDDDSEDEPDDDGLLHF